MLDPGEMRVGLIGCGAIGRGVIGLARAEDQLEFVGAVVAEPGRPRGPGGPPICASVDELLGRRPEVVIEVGGHAALGSHGPAVLRAGIDLLLVSVGALADPVVEQAIVEAACAGGSRAIVVSGAIGGLDALAAAAVGGLTSVTHTTRKPARTLLGDAHDLDAPRELFSGSAREGALRFPESINVAAAVSLAGIGLDRTVVKVIADPGVECNMHEVVAHGAFGTLRFEIRNVPTDDNPRTGRLVAMSVVHALRRRRARVVIG
jgi:aspartate dehydrogenase